MKRSTVIFVLVSIGAIFSGTICRKALAQNDTQESHKVAPVYLPRPNHPPVTPTARAIEESATGKLPGHDGEPFRLTLKRRNAVKDHAGAKEQIAEILRLAGLNADMNSIVPARDPVTNGGLQEDKNLPQYQKQYDDEFQNRLHRKLGKLSPGTTEAARKAGDDLKKEAQSKSTVFAFKQVYQGLTIENTGLSYTDRENGMPLINGNVFTKVNMTNQRRLSERDGQDAASKYLSRSVKVKGLREATKPVMVILPFAEGFKYAWKYIVDTDDGAYMLWIDAGTGKVLQLLPQYSYDSAQGLRFNPNPNVPTVLQSFEVNAPSGGNYTLNLTGVLQVTNNGADGCNGNVTVVGGSGSADFDVSPINSTTNVQTAAGANYNCRFQEVNTFATIYWLRSVYNLLGSQTFPMINADVNEAGNSNFFDGVNTVHYSIGNATMGNTTQVCPAVDKFSGGIDATCIAHEFGHYLNMIQVAVSGGTMTGSINEGLADWWACTMYNTDTFGAWYGQRCPPTESGFLPRQAEGNDVFPRHRSTGGGEAEIHSDGQMICWALWNMRREYSDESALGVLATNLDVMKALTTAGQGIFDGITDENVHDSYVDLEAQLVKNSGTGWMTEKIVSSFARAGLFLSDREAIIDIDDDYLNRNSATPPTFTVWTGRDYTFNGAGNAVTTGAVPFNTNYVVEVAGDAAFTVNFSSSGTLGGVTSGQGGWATWQLTGALWNTLKAGNYLYYRVRTMDGTGGNVRNSSNAGDGDVVNMNPPFAVINNTGECECSCTTASGATGSKDIPVGRTFATFLVFSIPIAYGAYRRIRARQR